jgi:hypothetical protein
MAECSSIMFHPNEDLGHFTSLYKPFLFIFRVCVVVVHQMVEARREGPKPPTNATRLQNKMNQVSEQALGKIFQDIRKQVLGTSQGENHPQVEPLL